MMPKNKKTIQKPEEPEEKFEDLPFAPPETHYLAERYIVNVPVSRVPFDNRWELRVFAERELERRLGDEVQLTSMKVHKPHLIAKSKARFFKREPEVRLVVTIKF